MLIGWDYAAMPSLNRGPFIGVAALTDRQIKMAMVEAAYQKHANSHFYPGLNLLSY